MIRCPSCNRPMTYKAGTKDGRDYEFYGCTGFPTCRGSVQMHEADKYDDGKQYIRPELSIEEEGERIQDLMLSEGWDADTAAYARHMWEKD